MNLDPSPTSLPRAPIEWTMEMIEAERQQIALVLLNGTLMCRVSLALPETDPTEARRLLADKARLWIAEYLRRSAQE